MRPLLSLLLLAACAGPTSEDPSTYEAVAPSCLGEAAAIVPADDAIEVLFTESIEVALSVPDGTLRAQLRDEDGNEVSLMERLSADRATWYFDHTGLQPDTTYEVDLTWCGGHSVTRFTTSDIGTPVDPATLVGRAYRVDLTTGTIVQPQGLGDIFQGFADKRNPIVRIEGRGEDLALFAGTGQYGDDGLEVVESSLVEIEAAIDFSADPLFVVTSEFFTWNWDAHAINFEDSTLVGAFTPDAESIVDLSFSGLLDTRPLSLWAFPQEEDGMVCDLLADLSRPCEPCADGETRCIWLEMEGGEAYAI